MCHNNLVSLDDSKENEKNQKLTLCLIISDLLVEILYL